MSERSAKIEFHAGVAQGYWEELHLDVYGHELIDRVQSDPTFMDRLQLNTGMGFILDSHPDEMTGDNGAGPRFELSPSYYFFLGGRWWISGVAKTFIDHPEGPWRYGGGLGAQAELLLGSEDYRIIGGIVAGADASGKGDPRWIVEAYGGTTIFDLVTVRAGYDIVQDYGQLFATVTVDLLAPARRFARKYHVARARGESYEYDFGRPGTMLSDSDRRGILSVIDGVHPDHLSEEYLTAMRRWPEDEEVWPHLTTAESRVEFIKHVLRHDTLSRHAYVPDDAAKETGDDPFVCRHFSRILYYRYRQREDAEFRMEAGASPYEVKKAPAKYRMPIREVRVRYVEEWHTHHEEHAVNAIGLGGDDRDPSNWIVFEPQADRILFHGEALGWGGEDAIFSVWEDHDAPLIADQDGYDQYDGEIVHFRPHGGRLAGLTYVRDWETSIGIDDGDVARVLVGMDRVIYDGAARESLIEASIESGRFSPEDIETLRIMDRIMEENALDYGQYLFVKRFLSFRATYFDLPDLVSNEIGSLVRTRMRGEEMFDYLANGFPELTEEELSRIRDAVLELPADDADKFAFE